MIGGIVFINYNIIGIFIKCEEIKKFSDDYMVY